MQTHNLKLPKNYRDTSSDFYIKVGIGLIALLLILSIILLTLLRLALPFGLLLYFGERYRRHTLQNFNRM